MARERDPDAEQGLEEADEDRRETTMKSPTHATTATTGTAGEESVRLIGARELLGARGVLRIELDGEIYTLRLTRNKRLILTK